MSTGRRRKRIYTPDVVDALTVIWTVSRYGASRRLHPFLPEMVSALERHDEPHLMPTTRQLLLQMSPATMDRLLEPARRARIPHGRSTTKPGTLLSEGVRSPSDKKAIAIRR